MNSGLVVMIGFGHMMLSHLDQLLPPRSVLVVEDPDIVVKRDVATLAADLPCVADVVPGRYHQSLDCIEAVERQLAGRRVRAVLPGLEYGVFAAAALAERWGLPGASTIAAGCLTDKLRLREATSSAGMRHPDWAEVHSSADLARFAGSEPVVLKPANRHASLGVQLLTPEDDLRAAWTTTVIAQDHTLLPNRPLHWRYLAERTLCGHEYSTEAVVREGRVLFFNATAKATAPGRHPVEIGHVVPADIEPQTTTRFTDALQALVKAVDFKTGVLHAEWMLDDAGPVLIECAGRPPGDYIPDLINAAYGMDLLEAFLAVLAGEEPWLPDRAFRSGAVQFLTAPPGRVVEISTDAACSAPGVLRVELSIKLDDSVGELRSSWDRVGEVIAIGSSPAEAVARAQRAAELMKVRTELPQLSSMPSR